VLVWELNPLEMFRFGMILSSRTKPFGQLLDHGEPKWVFLFTAATAIVAGLLVNIGVVNRRPT
jgi:hypothetical protein